jgi:glycine/D-amino acid oxidase-like deaminating enzyme
MAVDAVIVGAGVIGCSIAYEIARRGLDVQVLEETAIGAGASGDNPGVVSVATKAPGLRAQMARAGFARFQELLQELNDSFELSCGGSLLVFETADEQAYVEARAAALSGQGIALELISAAAARDIQPLLEAPVRGAMWSPADMIVGTGSLMEALAAAAKAHGAQFSVGERVTDIQLRDGRVFSAVTETRTIETTWLVNAAGIGARDVGRLVGLEHPIVPRKGQLMSTPPSTAAIKPVRITGASELISKHRGSKGAAIGLGMTPQAHGTVILGGTHEDVGFDARLDVSVLATIAIRAGRWFPRLAALGIDKAWCGFRPHSATGLPLLGAEPTVPGYVIAGGYGGDGVGLAPITAQYVAGLLVGTTRVPMEEWVRAKVGGR